MSMLSIQVSTIIFLPSQEWLLSSVSVLEAQGVVNYLKLQLYEAIDN